MDRRIELDGCFNLRDLGGYPTADGRSVRWRVLFRSDALHHLTRRDVDHFVGDLGIRDVLDLRSTAELEAEGRGLLEAQPQAAFHHLPLFDALLPEGPARAESLTLADRYFQMAEFAKESIARVVTTLAESDAPAVYHCAAGKDRTGVISAVLLGVLGVRKEIIVADYAASQEKLDSIIDRLMISEGYQEMLDALPADTLHAEPKTMITLLERVGERYGSMLEYVRAIGVSGANVKRLCNRLLEPAR
jgi:protein-tyrosine phosphatase